MFRTELNIEEESTLVQLLDGKKLSRAEILIEIKACYNNTKEIEGKAVIKSLFTKIKNTSDCEYEQYIKYLLNAKIE